MHSVLISTQKPDTPTFLEEQHWQSFLESVEALANTSKTLRLLSPGTLLLAIDDDATLFLAACNLMSQHTYTLIFFAEAPCIISGTKLVESA